MSSQSYKCGKKGKISHYILQRITVFGDFFIISVELYINAQIKMDDEPLFTLLTMVKWDKNNKNTNNNNNKLITA